jgi:7,8-dihydropterin-6-yl-methyl-4-(beta-D-ribofuranosyl)aminobenzene 5'-phosphate synthase
MTEAVAGTTRLHAVIGGFHLPPSLSEDYVRRTVAGLKAMNSDHVIPAHCSGESA